MIKYLHDNTLFMNFDKMYIVIMKRCIVIVGLYTKSICISDDGVFMCKDTKTKIHNSESSFAHNHFIIITSEIDIYT